VGIMHFTQTAIRDKLHEQAFNPMKQCSYCGAKYPDEATACTIDSTPLDAPAHTPTAHPTSEPFKNDRLWFLFLGYCTIITVFGIFSYISNWQRMDDALPAGALIILRCIVFLRPFAILAMWWDSRSGVVAEIAFNFISIGVCAAIGLKTAFSGIIGVIILILLVRPRWQHMVWDAKIPGNDKDGV
jgi:hypothetical protein